MHKSLIAVGLVLICGMVWTPVAQATEIIHVVQPGETLYRIGLRYGVSWQAIGAANKLTSTTIYVGQRLLIPIEIAPASAPTAQANPEPEISPHPSQVGNGLYTVVPGDTLWRIARRFGVSPATLIASNHLTQPNRLYPGQTLIIPGQAATPVASLAPVATDRPAPPDTAGLPQVSPRAREIYQAGLQRGNNPHAFAKVGDCNSTQPKFLAAFDTPGSYHLAGPYAYLQETVTQFAGSFGRSSQAVHIGYTAYDITSPEWADPRVCQSGENPLQCEYRLQQPSLAIISLGTNDRSHGAELFEKNLRTIIEQSIALGVLPILGTKADNLEGQHRYNEIIRRLAGEYAVPLWDFWGVVHTLPAGGLYLDGYHLTDGPAIYERPENIYGGWGWRNLTALQTLEVVWRGVR